jgi:hypothetical protein
MMIFSAIHIYAQPRLSVEEEVERLTNDLDLSEEQAHQIENILIDSRVKADKLRDSGLDRREMMKQMRDLMDETNDEIESILNDEQTEKFREIVERRKEEMQRRRPPHFNKQ